MRSTSKRVLSAAAAITVASLVPTGAARATDYTWGGATGAQAWNNAANWSPAGFPNAIADTGNLAVPLAANLNLSLGQDVTAGGVSIGGTGPAVTTDVGAGSAAFKLNFNNSTGVVNNTDGNLNAYIDSIGSPGSVNVFSAPVVLQSNLSILKSSTNSLSLNGGIQIDSAAGTAGNRSLVVNLASPNVLNVGDITSISTTAPTAGITNQIQIATANDSATTQWGTVNLNGVISNGAPVGGFNVNTRVIFGSGGANNNNNSIATINVNGNNTFSGGAELFRANVVLGTNTAFGTSTVSFGGGASANSTGYNLISTDDARTMANALTMQRNLTIKGTNSLTWAGTVTQSNASNLFNLLPEGKTLTLTGVGGTATNGSTAGVALATDTNGAGRNFTFDGPGKTVVNGNVVNNNNNGFIDVVVAGGAVSTNGQITKNGTGVVLLAGTGNTYGQFTAVNGGTLQFTNPGAVGRSTSALANPGGAIGLDTGTLASFTHPTLGTTSLPDLVAAAGQPSTGSLALSAADAATNANFTAGALASPNASGMSLGALAGTVNYTGTITPAAGGYRLGGGAGTLSLGNANALTGAAGLTVTNGGKVVLGAANNYTGPTTIQGNYVVSVAGYAATNSQYQGITVANNNAPAPVLQSTTLSVAKLADGDSSLGNAGSAASNLVINGGALQYTGATAATTSRGFSVGTLGATLDSSGAGAVNFSNTAAIGVPDVAAGAVTGTTAAGSNAVTAVNDATNLTVGMTVSGANIPDGTTVAGIRPIFGTTGTVPNPLGYTVYLSANATLAGNATPLTFGAQNRTLSLTGTNAGANTVAGALANSAAGTLAVNKTGAGTWRLTGANTYTGGTNVQAGTLQVSRMHESNAVNIAGGKLQVLDSSPTLPSHPSGSNAFVSRPSSLTIANNGAAIGSRTYSGQLDLGNNDLIIDYDGASPRADIEDMVRAGYNGGDWLGNGIASSTANANRNFAIGVADNATLTIPFSASRPFSGQTVDASTILVKFTHRIDLDLDGVITTNDATIFNSNYSEGAPARWSIGDLDYDRVFTTNDATLFNSFYSEALASVPEPEALGLLGLGALGLLRRRRRAR